MGKGVWEWYLKQDGKEFGPLTHRELLLIAGLGKVRSGDRIWAPGFPSWVPADLIPGLLKPSLTLSAVTFSRSWEATLQRTRASFLRLYERGQRWLGQYPIKSALALPVVWVSAASVLLLTLILATMQNSEPSFAIGAPEKFSKAETPHCDPGPQLQAQATPIASSTSIPDAPTSAMHDEAEVSVNEEVVDATETSAVNEISVSDEVISPPTRKPVIEPPLRSIDTRDGARSVQYRLRDLGYLADDADGSWGPRSRIALMQFQTRAKIPRASGWDRRSERALFSGNALRASSTVSSSFVPAHF
jgi:uncharacterized protein DUF4339/putative peptidoglycan binding protein